MTKRALPGHRALPRDLMALGPFFAVATHVRDESLPPPWQPMTALVEQDEPLQARVQAVRAALAHRARSRPDDIEIRVAASVTQLGLTARLLAPAIGAITLGPMPISLSLDDLCGRTTWVGPTRFRSLHDRQSRHPPWALR